MSQRLIDAASRNFVVSHPGLPPAPVVPHRALVHEAVATLGWGTMVYACDRCSFEWRVWLTLGVEGPTALRATSLFVPVPFGAGRCPAWPVKPDATAQERAQMRHMTACDGQMTHVRFHDDEAFEPRLIPDDAPRFALDNWHEHGVLVIPEPAIVIARRFHADREEGGTDGD